MCHSPEVTRCSLGRCQFGVSGGVEVVLGGHVGGLLYYFIISSIRGRVDDKTQLDVEDDCVGL